MAANGTDEAAQVAADLNATRPLRRAQHRGDEATLAVEHDDRLKPILVVMRVEEPKLLTAVDRVERRHHRLPTSKRLRPRSSSPVGGMPSKDAASPSSAR